MLYYQTTEKRNIRVERPIFCRKGNAWLGKAFYFWKHLDDARIWGKRFNLRKKFFEVYSSDIESDNILDTVFNQQDYYFFLEEVEAFAKRFNELVGRKPTIEDTCDFYNQYNVWEGIDAVLFQDLPLNELSLVERYYYRKRIQLAVYKEAIIKNYIYVEEGKCYGNRLQQNQN